MIKKAIRKVNLFFRKIKKRADKNVYFSLGENCLTDDILERYDLKSFSSPYSSGRSNIEYLLAFEKDDFSDILNPEYLYYAYHKDGKKVVRNRKYVEVRNKYHTLHTNGYEFTHHDPIGKKHHYEMLERRCRRLLNLKDKNVIALYHHRMSSGTDEDMQNADLLSLAHIYEKRNNNVYLFWFSQEIVEDPTRRRVERAVVSTDSDKIHIYKYMFYTLNEWAGSDPELLWARCDDDLLKTMIDEIREI